MRTEILLISLLVLVLGTVGCMPTAGQIQYAIAQTQTAAPYPTQTPYPTPTYAPSPTATQVGGITWSQLVDFLLKDHTNWNEWTNDYVCVNFSLDLVANARAKGINAWIVAVKFSGHPYDKTQPDGHTFVAFRTIDQGIIWVEPQTDEMYTVTEIGKDLCLANNPAMCWEEGYVTQMLDPALCDPISHQCWQDK